MRAILFLFAIVLVISCRHETEPHETEQNIDSTEVQIHSPAVITEVPYNVEYNEQTQALNLIKSNEDLKNASIADVIAALNKKHQGIKLDFIKTQKDTVLVKIDDASKLTQGMGSTGAEAYLAELTFSLTELPGIKVVKINFEEGDHAMPGFYTRSDFKELVSTE